MNRREMLLGGSALIMIDRLAPQTPRTKFTALSGRPAVSDRNFRSPVIERTIETISKEIADPRLRQIFQNCFPNTLDTTVYPTDRDGKPDTYVITGDIDAMWLRDSSAQVWPYLPFAQDDPELARLIEGVIRRHARLIQIDPYANAFMKSASDPPLPWAVHDKTEMRPGVGERKWEIDSLCFPVRLAHGFWKATGSKSAFDEVWFESAKRIVATFREQQRFHSAGPYKFQRSTLRATATLALDGYGNPVHPNGLICSAFRPSDDACMYLFFLPANLFAARTLERIGEISDRVYNDKAFADQCRQFANEVRNAVLRYGPIKHSTKETILAYEIDGYGSMLLMDDANAPGLVSLSYLELLPQADPLYTDSRSFALSDANPYFFRGSAGEGIGGPHVGLDYIWPMSIVMRGLTSTSDREIAACLQTLCTTTADTNFMHESFHKDDPTRYTRPWFAWANGLFGELVLKLHKERTQTLRQWAPTNA